MPASTPRKSLQDILKQRQQATFVGRDSQLSHFRQNLERPIDFRHFLFNVWGEGGVGKSALLRQFRQIAEVKIWHTAGTDETQTTVPAVMGQLAQQLEQQGCKLPQFSDRIGEDKSQQQGKHYRRLREPGSARRIERSRDSNS